MTLQNMEDCTACPDAELAERAVLYLAGKKSPEDVTGSSWVSFLRAEILDDLVIWFHCFVSAVLIVFSIEISKPFFSFKF